MDGARCFALEKIHGPPRGGVPTWSWVVTGLLAWRVAHLVSAESWRANNLVTAELPALLAADPPRAVLKSRLRGGDAELRTCCLTAPGRFIPAPLPDEGVALTHRWPTGKRFAWAPSTCRRNRSSPGATVR